MDQSQPNPAPAPPPRLWRGETTAGATRVHRRGLIVAVAMTLALIVAAAIFLMTWIRPTPAITFIPIAATGLEATRSPFPAILQGGRDLLAFQIPDRNPLARALAPGFGTRDLVDGLASLDISRSSAADTLVVSLAARACVDPAEPRTVWVLPADVADGLDRKIGWITLDEILKKVATHPALHKFLILDLHPIPADPRLGLLDADLGSGVQDAVDRYPSAHWLVLSSCGPGEIPATSEALGRSVFSDYLEEGLRGWADVAEAGRVPDGRVMAKELASFVRERVERWVRRNRGTRQLPTLIRGDVEDFPLVVLKRGQAGSPMELVDPKTMPVYPDWLLKGWKTRDQLKQDGADRQAPRTLSELENALLAAEHDWRGGADPEFLRASLADISDRLLARLALIRTIPKPRPASLAMVGKPADPAVASALSALLAKRLATPGATEASDAALIAGFLGGFKTLSDFDLAASVIQVASEFDKPDRDTFRFINTLLRTRQPRPFYIETLALDRLVALPPFAWNPPTIRLALRVAIRGEQASANPANLATVRPLLDASAQRRHEAEAVLRSFGFVPVDQAEELLRLADRACTEVIAGEEVVEQAHRLVSEAFWLLPGFGPLLKHSERLDTAWHAVATETRQLIQTMDMPAPVNPTASRARLVTLTRQTASLRSRLDTLREPLEPNRLLARDVPATPALYNAIDALLNTPFPEADARARLWASLWSIDYRLNEETFRIDAADGRIQRAASPPSLSEASRFERETRAREDRLSVRAVALLGLGGDDISNLDPTDLVKISRVWLNLPDRVRNEPDDAIAERLSWLLPPRSTLVRLDDPERNPARRLRVQDLRSLRGWLTDLYAFEARDLEPSPTYAALAQEYRLDGDSLPPPIVVASTPSTVPALDPARPRTTLPLTLRLTGPDLEAAAAVEIVTPGDWLQTARGTPWPSNKSPFPKVESSPLTFTVALATAGAVKLPVDIRIGTEGEGPPPLGVLVRSKLGYRTSHERVPMTVIPASRQLRIVLSADPARPSGPIAELRLRPVRDLPGLFLYVENPSEIDRKLLVQMLNGGAIVPGCEVPLTVKTKGFEKVSFGAPAAKPELDRFTITGPVMVRLLDASDPTKVVAERVIPVEVASSGDYARVVDARFDPPGPSNQGKSRLMFKVRAVAPIVGPPLNAELVLSPERIPGLLAPGEGTLRVELTNEGDEATLFAEGLTFDARENDSGYVDLTIDGVERAAIYRTTFARRGESTTPRLDNRPAIRLKAPKAAFTGSAYEVGIAIDQAPQEGHVELVLGRYDSSGLRADQVRDIPSAKTSIHLNPRGPAGSLRFEAEVRDPVVTLDVRRIRGRRELRGRLLDPDKSQVAIDSLPIVFDDSAPSGVKLIEVPKYALKGQPLTLKAVGNASVAGVKKVSFFAGKPVEGKVPPNVEMIEAKPVDAGRLVWSAVIPIPAVAAGALDLSVQFESAVGLSSFDTATVQVVDTVPVAPGKLKGKVVEGTRPQAGFAVLVLDPKGANKGSATTDKDGRFEVSGLAPGPYKVVCDKATPPTRGESDVTIQPGADAEVTVEMLRTRARPRTTP